MSKKNKIEGVVRQNLNVTSIEVINNSHLHAGHMGDDKSGESHYKIVIVSPDFEGKSKITRHKMVYAILKEIIANTHAIELKLFTDAESGRVVKEREPSLPV